MKDESGMTNSEIKKECNCYPLHQPGMTIEVDSFNPLICSKCKNVIHPTRTGDMTMNKELSELSKLGNNIVKMDAIINAPYLSCDYKELASKKKIPLSLLPAMLFAQFTESVI